MKIVKEIFKVGLAGIVAITIISLMLCVYNIMPVHIENNQGNTDYVWPANSRWVKMTEGISWGQFDDAGYNNLTVISNPDIIILGSSHMEATNVMQDENVAYLLSKKLAGQYSVYNMGISGHDFAKVCQYLPDTFKMYNSVPKITVVETSSVDISEKTVDNIINHNIEYTPSYSNGVIGLLQKIPFFRSVYHQLEEGLLELFMPNKLDMILNKDESVSEDKENVLKSDISAYNMLFDYLCGLEEQYNTQIIIFYHPSETIMEDGSISFTDDCYLETFKQVAEEHNVTFIDMTQEFERMYYEEHHVAHGFTTGILGYGHLNAYGHASVANEVYKAIMKLEEE